MAGTSKRSDELMAKFKLGPHYAMERFGILLGIVTVCFLILTGFGIRDQILRHEEALSTDTLYPSNYVTSRSKVTMAPVGVFANENRDSVVLLMKVSDTSKVSIYAEDYMVYLGAMNESGAHETLLTRPSVGFYFYDMAGYLAVTLQNGAPFPKQIMYGLFRNGRDFSGRTETTGSVSSVYDVWTVNFNPGADGVIPTKAFTDDGAFDADAFYYEVIISRTENALRKKLVNDVESMDTCLIRITEYAQRVKNDGIVVDGMLPDWVANDKIEALDDGSKRLVTPVVAVGGYDFDWYHGSVTEGYLDSLIRGTTIDSPSALLSANAEMATRFEIPENYGWAYADGRLLEDVADSDSSDSVKRAVSDVELLEDAISNYASLKYEYQVTHLTELLKLESSLQDSRGSFSYNVDRSSVSYNEE